MHQPRKGDFQPLLDKVAGRLQDWQVGMLSQGGRLVLVKIVLTAVPIYCFMALDPPLPLYGLSKKLTNVAMLFYGKEPKVSLVVTAWSLGRQFAGPFRAGV